MFTTAKDTKWIIRRQDTKNSVSATVESWKGEYKTMKKQNYEIREYEAWDDGEFWTVNQSWEVCRFSSAAKDEWRLFRRELKKRGIQFKRGVTEVCYDGSVFEIVNRKTQEPYYAMIPEY